jgi:hypothetical protein
MADAFSKNELVMFETMGEKFDALNVAIKHCRKMNPPALESTRANDTFWLPQPYISRTVDGQSLSDSDWKDKTQQSIPLSISNTKNVLWDLTGWDMRDPSQQDWLADAGARALSAVVNKSVVDSVCSLGALVVTSTGAASGYADLAACQTRMVQEECWMGAKTPVYLANSTDFQNLAANLAGRDTVQGKVQDVYDRSQIGMGAGFNVYQDSYLPRLDTGSFTTTTVTGAQSYVPVATSTNAINGGQSNKDNRFMTLTVGATANLVAGDVITIAGCNAVSMINKQDQGFLRRFRVVSVDSGTTVTITPPVINVAGSNQSEKDYGNVTAAAGAGVTVTKVSYDDAQYNAFWLPDSIYFATSTPDIPDLPGIATRSLTTDSGIRIVWAKQGTINNMGRKDRLYISYGVANANPQMNGIQLFNQTP